MSFIDIHGHYAWGVDDGIPHREEALKALGIAQKEGIKMIVATPHFTSGITTKEDQQMMIDRIHDLKILAANYDIKVFQGCEFMLNKDSDAALEKGINLPFENTQYMLCEYDVTKPTQSFLEHFDDYLRSVRIKGYKPIVAHVERYFHEGIDLDYVQYLIDLGCVIQINTTSVLGLGLPVHTQNAIKLLDANMVHVIATDTHQCEGRRVPNMQKAYDALIDKGFSKTYAELLLSGNPNHLILNEEIEYPHYKRSFFARKFKH